VELPAPIGFCPLHHSDSGRNVIKTNSAKIASTERWPSSCCCGYAITSVRYVFQTAIVNYQSWPNPGVTHVATPKNTSLVRDMTHPALSWITIAASCASRCVRCAPSWKERLCGGRIARNRLPIVMTEITGGRRGLHRVWQMRPGMPHRSAGGKGLRGPRNDEAKRRRNALASQRAALSNGSRGRFTESSETVTSVSGSPMGVLSGPLLAGTVMDSLAEAGQRVPPERPIAAAMPRETGCSKRERSRPHCAPPCRIPNNAPACEQQRSIVGEAANQPVML